MGNPFSDPSFIPLSTSSASILDILPASEIPTSFSQLRALRMRTIGSHRFHPYSRPQTHTAEEVCSLQHKLRDECLQALDTRLSWVISSRSNHR
ncbi:hypothetical protein L218DRAFT_27564 [Marasmius fiardii PR-910]|nr:hypothetical protein L218DRAFT_27564 [Marasmius fiardii PR-910]